MGLFLCAASLSSRARGAASPRVVFIENGRPACVAYQDRPWRRGEGYLQGAGKGQDLLAGKLLGAGDFHIRARLRILKMKRSAAAFRLGPVFFGFEGARGQTFIAGPMFVRRRPPTRGKRTRYLGPSAKFLRPGEWFVFEATRTGRWLRFFINGKRVYQVKYSPRFIGRFGFRPWRGVMRVSDFSAEGALYDFSKQPPGYTIPTIDLSSERFRQVVVDREKGRYLGQPDAVLLQDGKTILCVYPRGHGKGPILMKRSADAGLTWSRRLPTPKSWATSRETPTIYRVEDRRGKQRLLLFTGLYPIRLSVSADAGATWSELKPIGDFGGIVAMSDLIRLKDGSYMAVFHDNGRFLRKHGRETGRRVVYKTISTNAGLTWSEPQEVVSVPFAEVCEPGLVRSPDGRQIAMLLRDSSREFNSFITFSNDEGKTWTRPRELPAALTGDRHRLIYTADGRLFASFRDTTRKSPTKGDWVGWVGTYEDLVKGREGQYRVRLMDNTRGSDCGYSAVERLPDGTIVCISYGHWTKGEPPYIICVRFKMKELDEHLPPNAVDLFYNGLDGVAQYRIPALAVTTKGTLLAACDARVDRPGDLPNNIDIALRRSFDNGKTWSPVQRIVQFPAQEGAGDPCLLVDRSNGRIWLFYDHGVPHPTLPLNRQVTLHVIYSDDDGATWSSPRDIGADLRRPEWLYLASAPGNGIQLRSGRLVAPVYVATRDDRRVSLALYSDDHGATWRLSDPVAGKSLGEPQIVELADGTLMMNARQTSGGGRRAIAFSHDGGATWSEAKDEPQLPEPACQASFIRYTRLADGDDKNRLLLCNPADAKKRVRMTVRLSYDEGKTWPVARVINPTFSAYSSLAVLPDKSVGVLYERDPRITITFARFTLEWLTNGEDALRK